MQHLMTFRYTYSVSFVWKLLGDCLWVSKNSGYDWINAGGVKDFNYWKGYQVIGHLSTVLGVEVDIKKLRLVTGYETPEQEKQMAYTDKAAEQGNKMGTMFVALVRTDVPFNILYDFAEWVARISGYSDLESGGIFIRAFLGVFNDYNLANHRETKVLTDGQ